MKFWVFDRPMMVGAWAFAHTVDADYGDAPRCPSCGRFVGMKPWQPPYRARLVKGTRSSQPGDVITGPGFEGFMAGRRFVAEFERSKLKGIERWEPVHIEGLESYDGDVLEAFEERSFKLGILPVPVTRALLAQMHAVFGAERPGSTDCQVCGCARGSIEAYQGVVVDEAAWTGADIFHLTNLGSIIVTDHFAEFVRSGEFTGFKLVPAADFVPSFARRRA